MGNKNSYFPNDKYESWERHKGMYPGEGPPKEWSWDRLKYFIYKDQRVWMPPKPGSKEWKESPGFKDTTGKRLPPGVRIPDYRKYKIENIKELMDIKRQLNALGLKNPWLRNEVWRFDWRLFGTRTDRWLIIFQYAKYGLAAFILTETLAHLLGMRPRFKSKWPYHPDPHNGDDPYKMVYEMDPKDLKEVNNEWVKYWKPVPELIYDNYLGNGWN